MNDDEPREPDETPVVRRDPGELKEPVRKLGQWIDLAWHIALGSIAGGFTGAAAWISSAGLLLSPGRTGPITAGVIAIAELVVASVLLAVLLRRPRAAALRGFLIGFSIVLLLSSLCYGFMAFSV